MAGTISAASPHSRARVRLFLPTYGWRAVSYIVIICLLGADPRLDFLTLHAQAQSCALPQNPNITDTIRITNLTYDFDGHLTQVICPEGIINYRHDLATGRHTSTCTTNSYTSFGYDELGRLKTVTVSKRNGQPVSETTTYTYDQVGNRSTMALPNGVVTTYLYDSLNRLTNLTHTSGSTLLASYSYQVHPTGRRTNAIEILMTEGTPTYITNNLSWAYDGMYRLTNEVSLCTLPNSSYTNSFQYDLSGNRYSQMRFSSAGLTTITNAYDADDKLLTEVTLNSSGAPVATNNYAYDSNGSVIAKTNISSGVSTTLYAYDLKNKLSGVTNTVSLAAASYVYNDQGIRVRSTTGGVLTYYLIDANNHTGYQQILEELGAPGATASRSYVIGDDVLGQCGGNQNDPRYYLHDGHGSNRQLADPSGGVRSRYNFEAYGSTLASSTANPETPTTKLYCGEQYDSAFGMYNLRARFYDPNNGRFNARDTFAGSNYDPQSLHKYAYANCDPVQFKDPTGTFTLIELLVVITIIVILATTFLSLFGRATKAARLKAKRAKLEEDANDWEYTKALGHKAFDDCGTALAQLKRFPEITKKIAEFREKVDAADKVLGLAIFFVDLNIAKDKAKELPILVAADLQGENPDHMTEILNEHFEGKSWQDLNEEELTQVGQYILDNEGGTERLIEFYKDLEELVEEGEDVAISLP